MGLTTLIALIALTTLTTLTTLTALPTPYSLLLTPYSLLLTPYSLLPTPYSLPLSFSLSLSLSFLHMILFHDILKDTIFFRTYKMSQERGVICHEGQLPDQKVVRLQNPGTWCYANASI